MQMPAELFIGIRKQMKQTTLILFALVGFGFFGCSNQQYTDPKMGMTVQKLDSDLENRWATSGVVVKKVENGKKAQKAGLQTGSLVSHITGQIPLKARRNFNRIVTQAMEDDNTAILKLSGGKQAIISIRRRGDSIGLKVKGDQISEVTSGSPADRAGLNKGQTVTSVIDERNITSIKDYKKAIKDFSKHQQPITFRAIELSGVKIAAVKALGRLADEEGFNQLIELIQGSVEILREPATTALKELVLEAQKGKSTDLRQKINDGQVEALAKKYMQRENESNPEIRRSYLSILGVLQPVSAIQGLIEVVQDEAEQPGIRFKAGSTLSQIGREAVDPLIAAYQTGNLSVKDITASALGAIGSDKARKMLISALKAEQNPTIQLTLADAVARFKDADSRRVLANLRSGLQESSGLRMFLDELLSSSTVVEDVDKGTVKPELGDADDFDTL